MFDLFRSRQKTVRYLLGGLLSLVAISMVVTLVPYYGDGPGGGDQQIIAEIGDEVLTAAEVLKVMNREFRSRSIPPGFESVYLPIIVQQMVTERAVAYQAERMGLSLSDAELAEVIAGVMPQLYEGGKFAGVETYRAMVAQQNMTIPEFENAIRSSALVNRLEMLAIEGVVVTPQEVEALYKAQNEKIKISYALMRPDRYEAQVVVSEDELKQRYEINKASFQRPEKRGLLVFAIDEKTVASKLTLSDELLRKAYNEQLERFRMPERVRVRHILVGTSDKSDAEKAELKKKADGLLQQLKGGADFAKLATANSDDPGSAGKGGDLEWVVRGQTVPEFEQAAFSLKPGQLSEVVSTMFGYHILRVDAREQGRLRPFEEVRDELASDLMRGQVYERMQTLADQIRAALSRSPAEAEALARTNGITPVRIPPVNPLDPIPGVGAEAGFRDAVSVLPQGGVTPVTPTADNRLLIAQVTEIVPPQPSTLDEVRAQIRSQIARERSMTIFEDRLKEIEERVRLAKGDLASVARAMGLELKTVEVSRTDDLEGLGTVRQIEAAFTKDPGEVVGPVRIAGGALMVKVLDKKPADLTGLAARRESLSNSIKEQRARERQELFKEGILNELIRQKKVKIYDENVRRLTDRFAQS